MRHKYPPKLEIEHQGSVKVLRPADKPEFQHKCRDYHDEMLYSELWAWCIPQVTIDSIRKYADDHIPVGSFLEAVIVNDLHTAVCSADPYNLYALPAIVRMVHNTVPHTARGDRAKYDRWVNPPARNW